MSEIRLTDKQINEAEIEIACDIAIEVLNFLKVAQERIFHEAVMRRIELRMREKGKP